jgi:tetratricopeptide (TPR) repeat protein
MQLTIYDQPERYEKLMLQAAALDPACYYTLGDYMVDHGKEDQAAKYIDQACAVDPDGVRIASFSLWRVRYYLRKGEIEKARSVADQGGEVYSARGLEAKAIFLETTSDYDGAFEWYAKIEERYEDPGPLVGFCERYKKLTGNNRFDAEVNKRLKNIFPNGMEKVSVADFHDPPTDGVTLNGQSDQVRAAGLRFGDVIVAINGVRTHTASQFKYVRDLEDRPDMDLIVWQENSYREIKASPPNRKFGVDLGNYRAR